MPTTRQLVELFRAIAAEDMDAASAIAAQVSKNEEKNGHRAAARLLRGALNGSSKLSSHNGRVHSAMHPVETAGVLSAAVVRLKDARGLADVVLSPATRIDLENVVLEWKNRSRLYERGISPRSKLLFHGPPGCGKSLAAQALGNELGLPVYMVRFDAVIGAFLGQTAIHLRQLFHFAETTPCVLLLDELDALGKRRGNPLDVGELDRIVISLLQELEHAKPLGLIIGTSNLPTHLDDALWRRFDLDVLFRSPSLSVLRAFVRRLAAKWKVTLSKQVVGKAVKASSFAGAESVVIGEIRRQALLPLRNA